MITIVPRLSLILGFFPILKEYIHADLLPTGITLLIVMLQVLSICRGNRIFFLREYIVSFRKVSFAIHFKILKILILHIFVMKIPIIIDFIHVPAN